MSFEVDLRNSPGIKSLVRAGRSGYNWFSEFAIRVEWLRKRWLYTPRRQPIVASTTPIYGPALEGVKGRPPAKNIKGHGQKKV